MYLHTTACCMQLPRNMYWQQHAAGVFKMCTVLIMHPTFLPQINNNRIPLTDNKIIEEVRSLTCWNRSSRRALGRWAEWGTANLSTGGRVSSTWAYNCVEAAATAAGSIKHSAAAGGSAMGWGREMKSRVG